MSKLKSGVYFVKYRDINKFFQDAEANGLTNRLNNPQEKLHDRLKLKDRDDETVRRLVIPFRLDHSRDKIGFWPHKACFESEVDETVAKMNGLYWSEQYIEFYQSKKLIL